MTRLNTIVDYDVTVWPYRHSSMSPNTKLQFYGPDKRELYERNVKYLPNDWIYRDKEVVYNFNSLGLRMVKDLEELTKDIIYVSGTSFSMGIGIAEHDRYSDLLAKELSYDYINYSGPTYSIKLQILSFFNYVKDYGNPKVCVFEYAPHFGYTFFDKEIALTFYSKHVPTADDRYLAAYNALKETDFFYQEARIYRNMLLQYCNISNIKLVEISFNKDDNFIIDHGIELIDIDGLGLSNINERYARDLMKQNESMSAHPGIGVHKYAAKKILEILK